MFQPGELMIYGRTGVCRVERIENWEGQDYYVLAPLYQKCSIKIPVNSKVFMRPVMGKAEADALIDRIPSVQIHSCEGKSLRELTEHYQRCLESRDSMDVLVMNLSIRAKKENAYREKRKFGAVDERYLREGMALLHGELAAALDIPVGDVPNYIAARLGREPIDFTKVHKQ